MKPRILPDAELARLAREHGTPLFVYSARIVRERFAELAGFDRVRYAQKANPHAGILRLLRELGAAVDAVSAGELENALACGYAPREIAYTADLFDRRALAALARTPVPVNLGSPFMIEQYAELVRAHSAPRAITLRVNPGFGHGHARKVNTGGEASKHGIWHAELPACVKRARAAGLEVTGLHVHIGSGVDAEHLARVCEGFAHEARIATEAGARLDTISSGGGLPIPYREADPRLDVAAFTHAWRTLRDELARELGRPLSLEVEPGRYLVAEAGLLLAEVRGTKRNGRFEYLFLDAGFHNLLRPALYGAFHQISAVGHTESETAAPKVVAGPLCESGDVFTVDALGHLLPQALPDLAVGELVCIHDAGAYGASMSSSYNSQPRAPELLVE
ncbi:MAG: diaminopimelate decarboxylase [Planctomycetes bacterium]|nr:diaminopimelate decarboxylase [Planctomycetota bacterium]